MLFRLFISIHLLLSSTLLARLSWSAVRTAASWRSCAPSPRLRASTVVWWREMRRSSTLPSRHRTGSLTANSSSKMPLKQTRWSISNVRYPIATLRSPGTKMTWYAHLYFRYNRLLATLHMQTDILIQFWGFSHNYCAFLLDYMMKTISWCQSLVRDHFGGHKIEGCPIINHWIGKNSRQSSWASG